jgi:hypothetical protein
MWIYTWKKPQHGDIVAYIVPKSVEDIPSEMVICGMVVGIEGDKISIQDGKVLVNGKELTGTIFPLNNLEPISQVMNPLWFIKR